MEINGEDMTSLLHQRSRALVSGLTTELGFGSMSTSIYDTSWLSMIEKDGTWIFPECFDFILAHQLPCGAWESYATPVDGILNTAAALLVLTKRLKKFPNHADWSIRCQKATMALSEILDNWDVNLSDQVGFEMLVIQHISLLKDEGIVLRFPQMETLWSLRNSKLSKLPPEGVYESPSTLYHSLEALIGHINFDRVRQWRDDNGSMMGSPSSTAAYLMHSTVWDDEAEAYLRNCMKYGAGNGNGSVPCAWPTSVFEIAWVLTTLSESGVQIDGSEASRIREFLQEALVAQNGVLGFAPGSFPDADDTSKGISALRCLGMNADVNGLIRMFETSDYFRTYPGERNPSFSANCNVLICLLQLDDAVLYILQIAKAITFVTTQAFRDNVNEKWHSKDLYWVKLLAQAFEVLYRDPKLVRKLFDLVPDLEEQIPMVSLHVLVKVLSTQQAGGSWDDICEVTAYAILALSSLSCLPWVKQVGIESIISAIEQGKLFLLSNIDQWSKGHYLWIEKVTYASNVLSEAYCLAAAIASVPSARSIEPETDNTSFQLPNIIMRMVKKAGELIERTPLFSKIGAYTLRAAEVQAGFAFCALQRKPLDIFLQKERGEEKYLAFIPLALTATAAEQGCVVSLSVLYEMMVLSTLNFLADEYMERVIEKEHVANLDAVRSLIRDLFLDDEYSLERPLANGHTPRQPTSSHEKVRAQDSVETIKSELRRFIKHVLQHPYVLSSSRCLQTRLSFELELFLLAHIDHAEENHRYGRQLELVTNSRALSSKSGTQNNEVVNGGKYTLEEKAPCLLQYREPGRTFYNWVRSTSADNTSCPFSFIFFNCLMQSTSSTPVRTDLFSASARTAYLAEDLCRHLSSMCRMYNDYGSLKRDIDECNLNSANFPEFHSNTVSLNRVGKSTREGIEDPEDIEMAKAELLWMAGFERCGLETALACLENELGSSEKFKINWIKMFINLTNLYGEIYILKDIGTRTK